MPNFTSPTTPESLLGRNDSKNPSTTCKGLTTAGRPCRRSLATPKSSPLGRKSGYGVVAIVEDDGRLAEAEFYCWQHKDQAQDYVVKSQNENGVNGRPRRQRSVEIFPIKERSSIDTLVQRLGIEGVQAAEAGRAEKVKGDRVPRPPRRTETKDFAAAQARYGEKGERQGHGRPQERRERKKPSFWASLCCMTGTDDDGDERLEVVRHRRRVERQTQAAATNEPTTSQVPLQASHQRRQSENLSPSPIPQRKPVAQRPVSQNRRTSSNTKTAQLMSLIPEHLSPETTSALLAELIKPISPSDEEGYIYIFWLTPQSQAAPPEATARSLLSSPSGRSAMRGGRRVSDVMSEFSSSGPSNTQSRPGCKEPTILLKIGRASNVTRRMNEWQRQCGYALSLIRWYPYQPSSPSPSPATSPGIAGAVNYPDLSRHRRESSATVRKVPYVKRVERLIHLELGGQQAKQLCSACGKAHREWFQVTASEAGVRAVDECVRRWVGWAERQAGDATRSSEGYD